MTACLALSQESAPKEKYRLTYCVRISLKPTRQLSKSRPVSSGAWPATRTGASSSSSKIIPSQRSQKANLPQWVSWLFWRHFSIASPTAEAALPTFPGDLSHTTQQVIRLCYLGSVWYQKWKQWTKGSQFGHNYPFSPRSWRKSLKNCLIHLQLL